MLLVVFFGTAGSATAEKHTKSEPSLGVDDSGIFSDLDDSVQLALPAGMTASTASAVVDARRHLLVVYQDGTPVKVYPLTGGQLLKVGDHELALRPGDHAELEPLLRSTNVKALAKGKKPAPGDADDDGIPDPLDVLIGAKKTVANAASYGSGYQQLDYPGGDVPRDQGVCTDVVIRATRNAGRDLQKDLHEDIVRSRKSYPMVKKLNKNINHRRVKTLLPYFKRHWDQRTAKLDDDSDPLRAGDVVFLDTFPNRSGPDHIGIVSDELGPSGHPLVVNNWTNGSVTAEMDLLDWVPVTHRFRLK